MAVETGQVSASQSLLRPVFYEPEQITSDDMAQKVVQEARDRLNWVTGAGGEATARIVSKMYSRGYTGPLWEYLIR